MKDVSTCCQVRRLLQNFPKNAAERIAGNLSKDHRIRCPRIFLILKSCVQSNKVNFLSVIEARQDCSKLPDSGFGNGVKISTNRVDYFMQRAVKRRLSAPTYIYLLTWSLWTTKNLSLILATTRERDMLPITTGSLGACSSTRLAMEERFAKKSGKDAVEIHIVICRLILLEVPTNKRVEGSLP
jgi:hypothetical protein